MAKPLNMLKLDQEWQWGDEQDRAFVELMLGLGVMLTQCDDERKEFMVAYVSRLNNVMESRYSSYEREYLATVWAIAHFRCYLFGTHFTLVNNH